MGRTSTSHVDLYTLHGLDGLGADSLGAARGRSVSARIQRHAHGSYAFGVIGAGGRRLLLATGSVDLAPGSVFALNPGQVHGCEPLAAAQDYVVVNIPRPALSRLLGVPPDETPAFPPRMPLALAPLLGRIMDQLDTNADLACLRQSLHGLARALSPLAQRAPAPAPAPRHPAVAKTLALLEAQWDQPLTLEALSKRVFLSPQHLQRLFRKQVGTSPQEHLTALRVRKAAELARQGTPLAQAAIYCGFCDQSHLSRAFLRVMGAPPGRILAGSGAS